MQLTRQPSRYGVKTLTPWLVVFVGLNVLDAVMTLYGLQHGARELVPAPAFLLRHLGIWAFLVAKGAEVAVLCAVLLGTSLFLPRWARLVAIGCCVWFAGIVVWNGLYLIGAIRAG